MTEIENLKKVIERAKTELNELSMKRENLINFINWRAEFNDLPSEERHLMGIQEQTQKIYEGVLQTRIFMMEKRLEDMERKE